MDTPLGRAITAQIAPIIETELRQVRRRIVNFAAVLEEQEEQARTAAVLDLSENGFRFRSEGEFAVGAALLIKLPGVSAVRANVVWTRDGETGCAFDEALYAATVDQVIASATPKRRNVRPGTAFFKMPLEPSYAQSEESPR